MVRAYIYTACNQSVRAGVVRWCCESLARSHFGYPASLKFSEVDAAVVIDERRSRAPNCPRQFRAGIDRRGGGESNSHGICGVIYCRDFEQRAIRAGRRDNQQDIPSHNARQVRRVAAQVNDRLCASTSAITRNSIGPGDGSSRAAAAGVRNCVR